MSQVKYSVKDQIEVVGLKKRPEYNSCKGQIFGSLNNKQRYPVEIITKTVETIKLTVKPNNIRKITIALKETDKADCKEYVSADGGNDSSYPGYISNPLVHALHYGKSMCMVSVTYEAMTFSKPMFFDINDCINPNPINKVCAMKPYQIREAKLLNYLRLILYCFYSYQQMIHKYNDSGLFTLLSLLYF